MAKKLMLSILCKPSGIIMLLILMVTTTCYSQETEALARPGYQLRMPVSDTFFYETQVKSGPYVLPDNTIQLYPEEEVHVEMGVKNNRITSLTAVKEIIHTEKTVTIAFHQEKVGHVHQFMLLTLTNPFKKKLKYSADIFLMMPKKWITTNVLPVKPQGTSAEKWPDAIVTIALSNWRME